MVTPLRDSPKSSQLDVSPLPTIQEMKQMQLNMNDDNSFPIEVECIDVNTFLPTEGPIANVNIDISFSSDESEIKEQK